MKYAYLLPLVALAACSAEPPTAYKTLPGPEFESWKAQDTVTNVQDWDRIATKIADGLQSGGMVGGKSATAGVVTFNQTITPGTAPQSSGSLPRIALGNDSMFLRQLRDALQNEIIHRGGALDGMEIDLDVHMVPWGSRSNAGPDRPRTEGIWQATVIVDRKIVSSFREPFYVHDSDVGLFIPLSPPPPTPAQVLANSARPLQYKSK